MCMHRLRELRTEYGYKQAYVAEKIGMTQSAYSRIERNDARLYRDTISALKKLYGVSADYIIGEEGKNEEK